MAGSLSREHSMRRIDGAVDRRAFMRPVDATFYGQIVFFLVPVALVWLAKPERRPARVGCIEGR